jgi:hypothetical protein
MVTTALFSALCGMENADVQTLDCLSPWTLLPPEVCPLVLDFFFCFVFLSLTLTHRR